MIGFISSCSWGCLNLVHLLQEWICNLTSSDILGQKNLSLSNPNVFSIPKSPMSSWHTRDNLSYGKVLVTQIVVHWADDFSVVLFGKLDCSLSTNPDQYFNSTLIPKGSSSFALYCCNCLALSNSTMGPMPGSSAWACFHSSGVSCGFSWVCVILDRTLKIRWNHWNGAFTLCSPLWEPI